MKKTITLEQLRKELHSANEAVEDLNAGSSYDEIQSELEDADYESFCKQLSFLVKNKDPKSQALYDTFKEGWKDEYKDIEVHDDFISIRDLHPTQNVIFANKSLVPMLNGQWTIGSQSAVEVVMSNKSVDIPLGDPLVVCNVNGTNYLIDGHHRWSKFYAFNPTCKLQAYIIEDKSGKGLFASADDVLKFAQGTLAALGQDTINPQGKTDVNMYDLARGGEEGGLKWMLDTVNKNTTPEILQIAMNSTLGKVNGITDNATLARYLWQNLYTNMFEYAPAGVHDREYMPQYPSGMDPETAVDTISENTKITLTLGQLKRLVKESSDEEPDTQYQKCQKTQYSIQVYAPPAGTKVHNKLENSDYVVNEKKPFVLVGTVGEEWTVDAGKLKKTYLLDGKEITDEVLQTLTDGEKHEISTKPDGGINWCKFVPKDVQCDVETSWGETLQANRSGIPHGDGDYIVTADDGGKPNLNDRWVVNGEIFAKTYKILGAEAPEEEPQVTESTKFTLTIGQLRKLVKESRLNWNGPKVIKHNWDGEVGYATFRLGKIADEEYYHNPARRCPVDVTVSTDRGHFSASAEIGNANATSFNRSGQIIDIIADHDGYIYKQLPVSSQELVDKIAGWWKQYHLVNLDHIPEEDCDAISELIERAKDYEIVKESDDVKLQKEQLKKMLDEFDWCRDEIERGYWRMEYKLSRGTNDLNEHIVIYFRGQELFNLWEEDDGWDCYVDKSTAEKMGLAKDDIRECLTMLDIPEDTEWWTNA